MCDDRASLQFLHHEVAWIVQSLQGLFVVSCARPAQTYERAPGHIERHAAPKHRRDRGVGFFAFIGQFASQMLHGDCHLRAHTARREHDHLGKAAVVNLVDSMLVFHFPQMRDMFVQFRWGQFQVTRRERINNPELE